MPRTPAPLRTAQANYRAAEAAWQAVVARTPLREQDTSTDLHAAEDAYIDAINALMDAAIAAIRTVGGPYADRIADKMAEDSHSDDAQHVVTLALCL